METIRHAAIRWKDGFITYGKDHGECWKRHPNRENISVTGGVQGFLTSEWRFVNRSEADKIALAAGQLKRIKKLVGGLISDELWYYGDYDYNLETGYVKRKVKK